MNELTDGILSNPITTGIGGVVGGAVVGGLVGYAVGSRKRKKSSKRSYSKQRNHKRRNRKQRQPYTAEKRKDTSHRRIRFTKNNQPYVILRSGKARFIKKSSVSRSRKMKGGRY